MSTSPHTLEGALSKWTNVMKGWQFRWFVLDEKVGVLSYYTVCMTSIYSQHPYLHCYHHLIGPGSLLFGQIALPVELCEQVQIQDDIGTEDEKDGRWYGTSIDHGEGALGQH